MAAPTGLRIALLTYSTKPRGGVVHTLALAEALAELGHDVTVWSLARDGDLGFFRPVDPRVTVRLVRLPPAENESVGQRIVRSIELLRAAFTRFTDPSGAQVGIRYDVVHAQDCISANAVPRCIRTIHHLDTFSTVELIACHERAIVAPYAHICVSRAVADEVEAGWGLRPAVIANGVDAARFASAAGADRAAVAARVELGSRLGRYVLSVGGIEPRKGTIDLIEAMAIVNRTDPGLALVIAGGETLFDYRDYRAAVERRCQQLGVRPVVLGPVAHDLVPALMAQADVFAFPSVKEGFGMAAMEALSAGTPVVMRDLAVLREIFDGAARFAGTPDELAAALIETRREPSSARVAFGRQLAARHSWQAAAREHVEFYRTHPAPAA